MKRVSLLVISFSSNFEKQLKTDIGWLFSNPFCSFPLKIGVTSAIFKLLGIIPNENERLKIWVSGFEIS
jgi:hypothetical protein